MGIDPDLQAMLDDLRSGYGDARPAPKAVTPTSARSRDWELRTGYQREKAQA